VTFAVSAFYGEFSKFFRDIHLILMDTKLPPTKSYEASMELITSNLRGMRVYIPEEKWYPIQNPFAITK
jgi:hypothetical protein